MPKYIIEQVSLYRNVYVVEAPTEAEAKVVANVADDNWQEWLGHLNIDVTEYTDNRISFFKDKAYFWDGTSYKDEDGFLAYIHPTGEKIEAKTTIVK